MQMNKCWHNHLSSTHPFENHRRIGEREELEELWRVIDPQAAVQLAKWWERLEACHWVFRRLEVCQRGEPLYCLEAQ